MLSAGSDRAFRDLSVIRDAQSVEFSQGSIERRSKQLGVKAETLKLPPIVQFAAGACPGGPQGRHAAGSY